MQINENPKPQECGTMPTWEEAKLVKEQEIYWYIIQMLKGMNINMKILGRGFNMHEAYYCSMCAQ